MRHLLNGREMALVIAKEFSNASITVVSGMAIGIDTFAHKELITANYAIPLTNIGELISDFGVEYVKKDIRLKDLSEEEIKIVKEVRAAREIRADEIYLKTG